MEIHAPLLQFLHDSFKLPVANHDPEILTFVLTLLRVHNHIAFITVYSYNLSYFTVNLFLCLIYKLNLIVCVCI